MIHNGSSTRPAISGDDLDIQIKKLEDGTTIIKMDHNKYEFPIQADPIFLRSARK